MTSLREISRFCQVGSSLGGWLSLVAASRLSSRLHGLVLVAPALNYVWPYYHRFQHIYTLVLKFFFLFFLVENYPS